MTLKILLVDDHPVTRLGIRSLIQQAYPDVQISEAGTAQDALARMAVDDFDLVFLDAKLPARDGDEEQVETGKRTLVQIRENDGPRVVIMSAESSNRALVEDMMANGASTWVPKSAQVELTLEAIRRALSGGVWLPPEMIGKGGNAPPPAPQSVLGPLPEPITAEDLGITQRQFDVLKLFLTGLNAVKIASVLDINYDNVRGHLCDLYREFGTADQVSLHAYFAKTGQTLGIIGQAQMKPRRGRSAPLPHAPLGSPAAAAPAKGEDR